MKKMILLYVALSFSVVGAAFASESNLDLSSKLNCVPTKTKKDAKNNRLLDTKVINDKTNLKCIVIKYDGAEQSPQGSAQILANHTFFKPVKLNTVVKFEDAFLLDIRQDVAAANKGIIAMLDWKRFNADGSDGAWIDGTVRVKLDLSYSGRLYCSHPSNLDIASLCH